MDWCKYNASELKTLIHIERKFTTPDGQGGFTDEWRAIPPEGVYAKMFYLTGTERWEAKRVQGGELIRAVIRFKSDENGLPFYTNADRVVLRRAMRMSITTVQDVMMERRFLQIDMMSGKPS